MEKLLEELKEAVGTAQMHVYALDESGAKDCLVEAIYDVWAVYRKIKVKALEDAEKAKRAAKKKR